MALSQCRQNYHEESEAGVNKQINMELYASYVYMSMAAHFDRDDIALPGAHKYFKKASEEENEHAQKLMKFQNQRGGRVKLADIKAPGSHQWGFFLDAFTLTLDLEKAPDSHQWGSLLDAFTVALDLEKKVNKSLLDLHGLADSHKDAQMCDFLETHYLTEQVEAIKEIGDYITNLKRVGPGLGEYIFDKETLKGDE